MSTKFSDLPSSTLMVRIIDSSSSKLFVPADALFGLIAEAGVLFTPEYKNGRYIDRYEPDIATHMPPLSITTLGALRVQMVVDTLTK